MPPLLATLPDSPPALEPVRPRRSRPRVLLVFQTRFVDSDAMLRGIAHHERQHGPWQAHLDDEARAVVDPAWLEHGGWDGVICRHTTAAMAEQCRALGLPLVDLNDSPELPGVPQVRPDNRAIGHAGAEEFIERGLRQLAFAGYSGESWSMERRDGFREAAELARCHCAVFDVPFPHANVASWDEAESAQLGAWLQSLPKPVGILAAHDLRGMQVLAAARATGLLVPEEVAVIGVNNDRVRCELASPPLSSVATNSFQSGLLAAAQLDALLAGRRAPAPALRVEPIGVVTRQSSDLLAIDDRHLAAALGHIRENACRGLTVDQVLARVPLTRSRLEKGFRRLLGRSPQVEIRRVQVARVKQLLLDTDYPLKQIAEHVGFEHVEYLSVVFKRFTGVSPGQFRKRALGGEAA